MVYAYRAVSESVVIAVKWATKEDTQGKCLLVKNDNICIPKSQIDGATYKQLTFVAAAG